MLTGHRLQSSALADLEMIVVDVGCAGEIRSLLSSRGEDLSDGVLPAVILATLPDDPSAQGADSFDAVLAFPMTPAQISAQLSVILLAHRAFARRYHSALEELHLNRRIFRSVTSGISVASATRPDLPLIYVNPAFEVMTGYRLEDVAGRNCRFLQGEERDQPAITILREAILAEREVVVILKNFRKASRVRMSNLP